MHHLESWSALGGAKPRACWTSDCAYRIWKGADEIGEICTWHGPPDVLVNVSKQLAAQASAWYRTEEHFRPRRFWDSAAPKQSSVVAKVGQAQT